LASNAIEIGNGGMASALECFTTRIRGEDGGLEGRGMPEGKEEGALVGLNLDIADTNGIMRKLVNTQEARMGLMGKKGAVVAEQVPLMSSGSSSAAIDLAPDMGRGLEEFRVSGNSAEHIFTTSKTEGMTFTGQEVNCGLVDGCNIIVMLVHGADALLVISRAGREITDNRAQISHRVDIKITIREGRGMITVRRADRLKEVSRGTVLEWTRSGEVNSIKVDEWETIGGVIKCWIRVLGERVVILFGNSLDKRSRCLVSQRRPVLSSNGKQWITGRCFPASASRGPFTGQRGVDQPA
jgi:hypothetical protein